MRNAIVVSKKRCETKPPILEWDKIADFENGTQPAIFKMRQKRRFVILQVASLGLSPKEISMKLKYYYTKQLSLCWCGISVSISIR